MKPLLRRLPGSLAAPASPSAPDRDRQPTSGDTQYGDHHSYLLKMRMEGGLEGIEIGPLLGRGSYGKVYKVCARLNNVDCDSKLRKQSCMQQCDVPLLLKKLARLASCLLRQNKARNSWFRFVLLVNSKPIKPKPHALRRAGGRVRWWRSRWWSTTWAAPQLWWRAPASRCSPPLCPTPMWCVKRILNRAGAHAALPPGQTGN